MAILNFRFISAAFLTHFLKTETKQALSSLFLKVLGSNSREADSEIVDSKVAHGKDAGSKKAVSEKVHRFSVDFTLCIF